MCGCFWKARSLWTANSVAIFAVFRCWVEEVVELAPNSGICSEVPMFDFEWKVLLGKCRLGVPGSTKLPTSLQRRIADIALVELDRT